MISTFDSQRERPHGFIDDMENLNPKKERFLENQIGRKLVTSAVDSAI